MPRTRQPNPPEFRRQIVELARAGRSISELAAEFEPSGETIRNWIKQAHLDEGTRSDGLTSTEHEELRRLRKENRRLQQERDILAKATAWFARETDVIPRRSSRSRRRTRPNSPLPPCAVYWKSPPVATMRGSDATRRIEIKTMRC